MKGNNVKSFAIRHNNIEMTFFRDHYEKLPKVAVHSLEGFDEVAVLARQIILEQSRTPFDDAGTEDSAGRAKGRRMRHDEIVRSAFDIAEGFLAEATARGHTFAVPGLQEAEDRLRDQEDKN